MIQQSHYVTLQLQLKQFSPAIYFETDSIGLLRYIEKDSLSVCLYSMVQWIEMSHLTWEVWELKI